MEWLPCNYLKLMIQHGVKINMTKYPGGNLIEPKKAGVEHLQEAIDGWKRGEIKWVMLTAEEIEQQTEELVILDWHQSRKSQAAYVDVRLSLDTADLQSHCTPLSPTGGMHNNTATGEDGMGMGNNTSLVQPRFITVHGT